MQVRFIAAVLAGLAGPALAQSPSPSLPTPRTPGPNPGAAATDAVTNPTKPTQVAPPEVPARSPQPNPAPGTTTPPGAIAPGRSSLTAPTPGGEMRELVEAARAIVKSTEESVEYGRVVPDLLTQILAKLDKLENKLDKVENAVKAGSRARH